MFTRCRGIASYIGASIVCVLMFMWFGVLWTACNLVLFIVVLVNWARSLFPNRSEATVGKGERDVSDIDC